ncbi:hypothetical protein AB0E96_23170, partial [Kitasatospora sp. NPDC036755]
MGETKSDRDDGFQAFIVAVWPRLVRTAYLLAGEQYAAEDLVQSAAEKACAAWSKVSMARHSAWARIASRCMAGRAPVGRTVTAARW